MWIDFMKTYLDLYADRDHPPTFDPPGNIVFMTVDRDTGEVTSDANARAINEAFISGTQPSRQ